MKARWLSLLLVVVAISVLGTVLWALGVFEPKFNGLPASAYLRGLVEQNSFGGKTDKEKVLTVPPHIGVPILIRYTEAQDARWRGWYQRLYPKLPKFITRKLGPPNAKAAAMFNAMTALGFYGTNAASAVPRLLQMETNSTAAFVQERVVTTLGNIGPAASNAIPRLITHFQSGPIYLANSAAQALGKIDSRGQRTGALLVSSLNTSPIQYNAVDALAMMAAEEPNWVSDIWRAATNTRSPQFFARCIQHLYKLDTLDEDRLRAVVRRADDADFQWRLAVASTLWYPTQHATFTMPFLLKLGSDTNKPVRDTARGALIRYAQSPGVDTELRIAAVKTALPSDDVSLTWHALGIVRSLGPAAAPLLDEVTTLLSDKNERVRGKAAGSIVAIGPPARAAQPKLEQLLKDEWGFVREAAQEALEALKLLEANSEK